MAITVKELIRLLNDIKNVDQEIEMRVHTHNGDYVHQGTFYSITDGKYPAINILMHDVEDDFEDEDEEESIDDEDDE